MKKLSDYLFYIVIALIVGYFGSRLYYYLQKPDNASLAPDFEATTVFGEPFKLNDLQDNYVLLDFWGSWCGPCLQENPKLVEIYHQFKDKTIKGKKLQIVTVALEKNNRNWKKVADRFGFEWKYQLVETTRYVLLSPIAQKYGVTEIPAKFLIEPDGKIHSHSSFEEIVEYLESNSDK